MKKLVLIALLMTPNVKAIDNDKFLHFGVSAGLTLGMYGFSRRGLTLNKFDAMTFSSFTVMGIGLVKEGLDRQFDTEDLVYNALGIFSANILIFQYDF